MRRHLLLQVPKVPVVNAPVGFVLLAHVHPPNVLAHESFVPIPELILDEREEGEALEPPRLPGGCRIGLELRDCDERPRLVLRLRVAQHANGERVNRVVPRPPVCLEGVGDGGREIVVVQLEGFDVVAVHGNVHAGSDGDGGQEQRHEDHGTDPEDVLRGCCCAADAFAAAIVAGCVGRRGRCQRQRWSRRCRCGRSRRCVCLSCNAVVMNHHHRHRARRRR
mmetsp:Transcript_2526/g.6808  ORF Transcript_2526/g.6808 Transcript_2526/m.6808 type:complete len:222 (-) Transcript_2526:12-677(-)